MNKNSIFITISPPQRTFFETFRLSAIVDLLLAFCFIILAGYFIVNLIILFFNFRSSNKSIILKRIFLSVIGIVAYYEIGFVLAYLDSIGLYDIPTCMSCSSPIKAYPIWNQILLLIGIAVLTIYKIIKKYSKPVQHKFLTIIFILLFILAAFLLPKPNTYTKGRGFVIAHYYCSCFGIKYYYYEHSYCLGIPHSCHKLE